MMSLCYVFESLAISGRSLLKTLLFFLVLACLFLTANAQSIAQTELAHSKIDKLTITEEAKPYFHLCDDATFVRRIHLDLVGMIPSAKVAREFINSKVQNKRTKLVDQLLKDPRYARHMARTLDLMFMERRPDKQIKRNEWESYLLDAVEKNKPFNQIAKEIIESDGTGIAFPIDLKRKTVSPKIRTAVKFYLDREAEPNLITRDVGRIFFGVDLQCAQCHDHPNIDSYYQEDYYGIFAFVSRGTLFSDKKAKVDYYAEKAEGDANFKSVFTGDSGTTAPFIPGEEPINEPKFAKEEAYKVKPEANQRPVPKFSRREALAKRLFKGDNAQFRKNIANRLWANMMGRGLVHPVDLHHVDNPPSHPALLDLLANEFAKMNFDIRAFTRELALTKIYQRNFDFNESTLLNEQNLGQAAKQIASLTTQISRQQNQLTLFESELTKLTDSESKLAEQISSKKKQIEKTVSLLQATKNLENKTALQAKNLAASIAKIQKQIPVFETATQSLQTANRSLPGEKSLENSLVTFTKKLQSARQQLKLQTDQQQKVILALKSATSERQKIAQQKETEAGTLAKLQSQFTAVSTKLNPIKNESVALQTKLTNNQKQLKLLNAIKDYSTDSKQFTTIVKPYEKHLASLVELDRTTKQLSIDLTNASKQKQTTQTDLKKSTSEATSLEKVYKKATEVCQLLEQSRSALHKALEIVGGEMKLAQTHNQIQSLVASKQKELEALLAKRTAVNQRLSFLQKQLADSTQKVESTTKQLAITAANIEKRRMELQRLEREYEPALNAFVQSQKELTQEFSSRLWISELRGLSPEQTAWSIFQATGYIDSIRTTATTEYDKKNKIDPTKPLDKTQKAARDKSIHATIVGKLLNNEKNFVRLFAAAAGQPQDTFFATVDQALYFSNSGVLRSWSYSANGIIRRTTNLTNSNEIADEIYLSILTRFPSDEERRELFSALESAPKEKAQTITNTVWALLTSIEFRFNH